MSFEYSGRTIPDDDAGLVALIRREAKRTLVEDRRDGRPEAHLDWISGMLTVHPELVHRVESAYLRLLAEPDPEIGRAVLDQADQHPSQDGFVRLLVTAIADSAAALRRVEDVSRTDGTTLLGAAVRTLNTRTNHRAPLTPAAANQLETIDRAEDGWPESEALLLNYDFDRFSSRLVPTVTRLAGDDEPLSSFAAMMANSGAPLTTRGFDLIGRAGGEIRDRFAERLQAFLSDAEASRQELMNSKFIDDLPRETQDRIRAPRSDPWPEFAARLGVG